jgi:ABC-2 type transport system permease protein
MSTALIARKDFDDAVRSRMILAITAIFVFFSTLITAAPALFGDGAADVETAQALSLTMVPAQIIVPIVALIVGYMAIVGERQSGSVKILLGFPHSRFDVVAGKLIGRTGVITLGIVVGFTVATVVGTILYGGFPAADFAKVLAVTVLLGAVFTGYAVGVSAGVTTRGKAMALVIGMYILFNALWQILTSLLLWAVEGEFAVQDPPTWYELLVALSPMNAFESAATYLDIEVLPLFGGFGGESAPSDPFFLQDWFGFVILLAWMVIPLALGYWRFERADLG